MECRVVKGENHSLTGGREEFKAMAGEHFPCYTFCADSLIHSMSELLTAKSRICEIQALTELKTNLEIIVRNYPTQLLTSYMYN